MIIAKMRKTTAAPTSPIGPKRAIPRCRFLLRGKVIPNKATTFRSIWLPSILCRALIMQIETRLLENPPQKPKKLPHIAGSEDIFVSINCTKTALQNFVKQK